ncbi:MAG: hypothetical protein ACHREM_14200 [Polyangiales bacterium]
MIRVALVTENNAVDGVIFVDLVKLMGLNIEPWSPSARPFPGLPAIWRNLAAYLQTAEDDGVEHALVAIDNDGGARRNPPHQADHVVDDFADDWNAACRVCRLRKFLPPAWNEGSRRSCLVVCMQTIETWLLVLKGHAFSNARRVPERDYGRDAMKKAFWGDELGAGDQERVALARTLLARHDALALLGQRPSFMSFVEQIEAWKPVRPAVGAPTGQSEP